MKDVSTKPHTLRTAAASSSLRCQPATIEAIRAGTVPKGDPLGVARVAGILAAKNTGLIIPFCHPVPVDHAGIELTLDQDSIRIVSEVKAVWKTGVEMEALVAASVAALTLYDMLKPIDGTLVIGPTELLRKTGGKSDAATNVKRTLTACVLVASDSRSKGGGVDRSGSIIAERLGGLGISVLERTVVPDDPARIARELIRMCDVASADLILTTGGTGVGPRDSTPEATLKVVEKTLPGVSESLRSYGRERVPAAMISRGVAGVRGTSLIINLPGSPGAVTESLDLLFPWILHTFDVIRGEGHDRSS